MGHPPSQDPKCDVKQYKTTCCVRNVLRRTKRWRSGWLIGQAKAVTRHFCQTASRYHFANAVASRASSGCLFYSPVVCACWSLSSPPACSVSWFSSSLSLSLSLVVVLLYPYLLCEQQYAFSSLYSCQRFFFPKLSGHFFKVVEYVYSMWLGNLMFVLFVLLGVSKGFYLLLSSGELKAGKSVVTVTTERTLDEPSTDLLSPKNTRCSVCSLDSQPPRHVTLALLLIRSHQRWPL